jgi:co-chaperonin GroES (HSP10)
MMAMQKIEDTRPKNYLELLEFVRKNRILMADTLYTKFFNTFTRTECETAIIDAYKKQEEKLNEQEWGILLDKYAVRPLMDRVLVVVDDFKTKLDCAMCKGKGHTGEKCNECGGNGRYRGKQNSDDRCTTCYICRDKAHSHSQGAWIDLKGKQPCPTCEGTGSSSLVIPDEAKKKPLTGNIIACGSKCVELKVGMKVLFTQFTGIPFVLDDLEMRHVVERDIICEIKMLKEDINLGDIREERYDEAVNVGVDSQHT